MSGGRMVNLPGGTKISYRSEGNGEFSAMVFSPEAQAALKDVEIKGVSFKDSSSRKKRDSNKVS